MLPYFGVGAGLPAADAPAADRRLVARDPAHRVDAVYGLLDDVVAREPAVVVPVAHLVLHVGAHSLARLAGVPDALRVVGRLDGDDVADLAVEDLFHGLAARAVVSPAEAVDQGEVLVLGVLARLEELAQAGPVDGHRLLDECVDALLDGVGEVDGPEVRRRGQEDEIDLVDHVLVAVEAGVLAVLGDVDARADRRPLRLERLLVEPILEGVGHGDELGVGVGGQRRSAAPVPRPPQPTSPTLIVLLPAAWTRGPSGRSSVRGRGRRATVEPFRKSRREAGEDEAGVVRWGSSIEVGRSRKVLQVEGKAGCIVPVGRDRLDPHQRLSW